MQPAQNTRDSSNVVTTALPNAIHNAENLDAENVQQNSNSDTYQEAKQNIENWMKSVKRDDEKFLTTQALGSKLLTCLNAQALHPRSVEATTLDLSGMGLSDIPEQVAYLTGLESLNLSCNRLTKMPLYHFKNCNHLKVLRLDYNELTQLSTNIQFFPKLETLNLSNNQLFYISPELAVAENLTTLLLGDNQLEFIPPLVFTFKQLKRLEIQNNAIKNVPKGLLKLPNLIDAQLAGNPVVESLKQLFGQDAQLGTQFLRSNAEQISKAGLSEETLEESLHEWLQYANENTEDRLNTVSKYKELWQKIMVEGDQPEFFYLPLNKLYNKFYEFGELDASQIAKCNWQFKFPAETEVYAQTSLPLTLPGGPWAENLTTLFVRSPDLKFSEEFVQQAKNLEKLTIDLWTGEHLPAALARLPNLKMLRIRRAYNLTEVISQNTCLSKLELLWIDHCTRFTKIATTLNAAHTPSLKSIVMKQMADLNRVADSISDLPHLTHIEFEDCNQMTKVAADINNCPQLQTVYVKSSRSLQRVANSFSNLTGFENLWISDCSAFQALPEDFSQLANLKTIRIEGAPSLHNVPKSIGCLHALKEFNTLITAIEFLPNEITNCKNLEILRLTKSPLKSLPNNIGELSNLTNLQLNGTDLERVPSSITQLQSLYILLLDSCPNFCELPADMGRLINLNILSLHKSGDANPITVPFDLAGIPNLHTFTEPVADQPALSNWYHFAYSKLSQVSNPKVKHSSDFSDVFITKLPYRPQAYQEPKLNGKAHGYFDRYNDTYSFLRSSGSIRNQRLLKRFDSKPELSYQQVVDKLSTRARQGVASYVSESLLNGNYELTEALLNTEYLQPWVNAASLAQKPFRQTAAKAIMACWLAQQRNPSSDKAKNLSLSGLKLTSVPECLGALTELVSLDLSENKLDYLYYSVTLLKNLQTLNLSGNRFKQLPSWVLKDLPALKVLNASGNSLTQLNNSLFTENAVLESLDLSANQLAVLPSGFFNLIALKSLALSKNTLKTLPKEFSRLQQLQQANFQENMLVQIQEQEALMPALQMLDLSNNQLKALPNSFGQFTGLRALNLETNQFQSLPDQLCSLQNLQNLELQNNLLAQLPESIGQLKSCTHLNLSHNQLVSLPVSMNKLERLEVCDVSENKLLSLPAQMAGLRNLHSFFCQYNQLSGLPETLRNLSLLTTIDARGNPFSDQRTADGTPLRAKTKSKLDLTEMLNGLHLEPRQHNKAATPNSNKRLKTQQSVNSSRAVNKVASTNLNDFKAPVVVSNYFVLERTEHITTIQRKKSKFGLRANGFVEKDETKVFYYSNIMGKYAYYCFDKLDDLLKYHMTVQYLERNGLSELGRKVLPCYPTPQEYEKVVTLLKSRVYPDWSNLNEYNKWNLIPKEQWVFQVPTPIYKPWV